MIVALRTFTSPFYTGFNVLLFRGWAQPVSRIPRQCFRAFDATLNKVSFDPEATQLFIDPLNRGPKPTMGDKLYTACEGAKRSLPEYFRPDVEFYVAAFRNVVGESRCETWSSLPAWADLLVESRSGQLNHLSMPSGNLNVVDWKNFYLDEHDSRLYLSLFYNEKKIDAASLNFSISDERDYSCFRLGAVMGKNNQSRMSPTLHVDL